MAHTNRDDLVVELNDIDPGVGFEYEAGLPLEALFEKEDGVTPVGDLEVAITFTRHDADVYLIGRASGTFRHQCGRCLREYESPLEVELQTACFPADEAEEEDEEDTFTYEGNTLRLGEYLREQFLLAQPVKQVCDEDCKGLCPRCGQDLNEADCGCDTREVDERLAVLKKLKEKQ